MRTKLCAFVVALAALVVPAALASGGKGSGGPYIISWPDYTNTEQVTNYCPFTIDMTVSYTKGSSTLFFDSNGNVTEVIQKNFEQDTFVGPGPSSKTLVGEKYSVAGKWFLDSSGNITSFTGDGPVEKVWLPDGSLFLSAGRLVLLAPDIHPTIVPDVGHSGNVAGFCKALAP